MREVADLAKIDGREDPKANVLRLVRNWLRESSSGKWMVILDNADDASFLIEPAHARQDSPASDNRDGALFDCLPVCDHGSVLITTRSEAAALQLVERSNMIIVNPMNEEDASSLLQKKLGRDVNETEVLELVAALEYMPLAISQAAAYIQSMHGRCSIPQYLEKLRKIDRSKKSVLDEAEKDLRRDREARNSIILTWQISFDHIHRVRPSAAKLLSLMSFCDRQAIPESLVRGRSGDRDEEGGKESGELHDDGSPDGSFDASADDGSDTSASSDNLDNSFDGDIRMLQGYSFISVATNGSVFQMHRLVQISTRKWLRSQGQLEGWKEQYIGNLSAVVPPGSYENWAVCEVLFPHAKSALELKPKGGDALLKWACTMYNAAWYALERVGAREAEKMAVLSMKARAKELGEDDVDTASSKAMVALARKGAGQWDEAEKLEMEVLETTKKVLGAEHPDTLTSMGNLASTYRNQGRWDKAEKLEMEVLEMRKEVLGAEHPDTLTSMGNLALTYSDQGQWNKAEKLGMEVLEIRKEVLGAEHPDTLMSIANLATTYSDQGRWDKAEKLEVEVLETRKEVLGAEHPDTLTSMANLALTYSDQGRWHEAEKLGVEVLETRKKVLGAEHPDTLTSIENLAHTLKAQGKFHAACTLIKDCASISYRILGPNHPYVMDRENTAENWGRSDR
jgi:tetratricopeptide (TPR) repeat protein